MGCPPRRRHRRPVARGPGRSAAGGLNGSTRRLRTRFGTGSGGEDLIEDRLGIGLIGLLGQRQLGDQNLPRLGEHPLLPGREEIGRASCRERGWGGGVVGGATRKSGRVTATEEGRSW